jgi:hypothetical protein
VSLSDLTALKTAIASDWLHRADLTTAIGDFVALFESDFNSKARHRQMETETTITSTTGFLVHPTGWIGWKQVSGTSAGRRYDLEPVTDEIADKRAAGLILGSQAILYKVKGSRTYLYPPTDANYDTTFYVGVSLASGTNWLLTAYPAAYLYGSLLQATASIGSDARLPLWVQAYDRVMDQIAMDSKRQSWSGQVLRMNPDIRVV